MQKHNRLMVWVWIAMVWVCLLLWFNSLSQRQAEKADSANRILRSDAPIQDSRGISYKDISGRVHARIAQAQKEQESERRARWIENFPFQPTYHPSIRYDPELYHKNSVGMEWGKEKMDYDIHRKLVQDHGFLKGFFENESRYSKEFQQVHEILKEYDRAGNPEIVAGVFNHVLGYYEAKQKDPKRLLDYSRWDPNRKDKYGNMLEIKIPVDGKTTWGEQVENYRDGIIATLISPRMNLTIDQARVDFAEEIASRLLREIPSEGILSDNKTFTYQIDNSLQAGDPLLVPWETYMEDYLEWDKQFHAKLAEERLKQIPPVLKLGPDGKIFNPFTGEQWRPGAPVSIIKKGEVVQSFNHPFPPGNQP